MDDIVKSIKQAAMEASEAASPVKLLWGKVIVASPLKIQIDQKLVLASEQLVLTHNVLDYQTKISFDNAAIKQLFTTWDVLEQTESQPAKIAFKAKVEHEITIYNHLEQDDEVLLAQLQGGQKFVVLEKVVKA
jgi:hypothetical protein